MIFTAEEELAIVRQQLAALKASSANVKETLAAAERELRNITLLLESYEYFDFPFQVEIDPAKSTQGSITHPKGITSGHGSNSQLCSLMPLESSISNSILLTASLYASSRISTSSKISATQ